MTGHRDATITKFVTTVTVDPNSSHGSAKVDSIIRKITPTKIVSAGNH
jgi:hypothetical protein